MKKKIQIIAEAGVNHNGELEKALKLIDIAADSGADIVKFQTFNAEKVVSLKAKKAKYQHNLTSGESQFSLLKKLEIPLEWYPKLVLRCKQKRIEFLSTGFDEESINFLDTINMPFFKIPSGEITNKPLLEFISKKGKEIVLSTGMSTINEIEDAISIFLSNGIKNDMITILHCNTEYPSPYEDINLNVISSLKKSFNVKVGYSDHSKGIEVSIAAAALGSKIIEKHFTINNNLDGPDHKASLEPEELKKMIKSIRNIELALGSNIKKVTMSEKKNINVVRKSIHLQKPILKGEKILRNHLIMLRPGNGISPMEIDTIIGKKAIHNLKNGHKLNYYDLK